MAPQTILLFEYHVWRNNPRIWDKGDGAAEKQLVEPAFVNGEARVVEEGVRRVRIAVFDEHAFDPAGRIFDYSEAAGIADATFRKRYRDRTLREPAED